MAPRVDVRAAESHQDLRELKKYGNSKGACCARPSSCADQVEREGQDGRERHCAQDKGDHTHRFPVILSPFAAEHHRTRRAPTVPIGSGSTASDARCDSPMKVHEGSVHVAV